MKIEEAKVFVGCPSSNYPARDNYHFECWENLNIGSWGFKKKFYQNAHANINAIVNEALEGNFTHIMFIDDDMIFNPDCIELLLANDVDVVSGLYIGRGWPFFPMFMDKYYEERYKEVEAGRFRWGILKGKPRLIEVEACGMGAFLIKTDCFKRFEHPHYFREEFVNKDGEYLHSGCDLLFCKDLKDFGYKIHVDTRVPFQHSIKGTASAYYNEADGSWLTGLRVGDGIIFHPPYTARNDD